MAVIKIEAKKDTRCMQTICLIRGDRRTQILRFGVNRFDGGVDLSDLTWVIKTANAKGVEDVFEPEAVEIGENRITVDWLVDGSVTDADGMAKYELNGLDATEDGKGIVWKGGMGTMSLRADIGENFADIDMTNIDRLVLYVEGRLQHIIDLTDELQNAGETANAAATAANAGAARAESAAIAANTGATAATEAASNASAAAEAANTAALPHAQLYGMRVRGETAKANGNPVTFLPDAGSLIQPVTVLEPQQQGSGDPYPGGGGKNLLVDVTVFDTVWLKGVISLTAGITYTLSVQETADALYFSNEGGTVDYDTAYNAKHLTYTPETSGIHVLFARYANGADLAYNMMLEKGSAATEYAPPSNIRPFIGYDKLELNHAGKNLFNPETATTGYAVASDGTLYREAELAASDYIRVVPGAAYRIGWNTARWLGLYYGDKSFIAIATVQDSILIPPEGCNYIRATISAEELNTFYVSVGTALAAYKPYQGKLHTVQIGQTVYGFRYEWLSGKGLIEWALATLTGDETDWALSAAGNFYSYNVVRNLGSDEGYCSHYKTTNDLGSTDAAIAFYAGDTAAIRDSRFASVADWKAFLTAQNAAGTPVQIAYKLATPIEIGPFTPHIISASDPEQTNTLYGDGRIDVEYVKPLHVSIEERVAAAVAAAMNTEGE